MNENDRFAPVESEVLEESHTETLDERFARLQREQPARVRERRTRWANEMNDEDGKKRSSVVTI